MPTSLTSQHATVAILARHRPADDPQLVSARAQLREDVLINAVERALAKAPPLTPEVRQRVIGLLSTTPDVTTEGEVA